jgi:hypothetical protein
VSPDHAMPLREGQWWSCEHPERRHVDGVTVYDHRCRPCLLAMRAAIESGAFGPDVRYLDPESGQLLDSMPASDWLYDEWPKLYAAVDRWSA